MGFWQTVADRFGRTVSNTQRIQEAHIAVGHVLCELVEEAQPRVLRFLKGEFEWTGLDRANFSKMAQILASSESLIPDQSPLRTMSG